MSVLDSPLFYSPLSRVTVTVNLSPAPHCAWPQPATSVLHARHVVIATVTNHVAHTHTHIHTHTHRPVVFKERSASATYENELKSGCRQNSQRLLYQSRTRNRCLLYSHTLPSPPPSSLPLSFGETMIKSLGHKYTKTKWPVCVSPSFYQTRVRRHKESTDSTPHTHTHTHTDCISAEGSCSCILCCRRLGVGLCMTAESICPSY